MSYRGILTVWVMNAPGPSKFSRRGNFKEESILVEESNDSSVCRNLQNARFVQARRFGDLMIQFYGCLVNICFANNLLGRQGQRRTN